MGEMSLIRRHNATILRSLNAGDLVEFPRGCYSHWAVYLGDEKVAHLAGVDDDGIESRPESVFTICGVVFNKANVCIDDFWKVAADSKARKNNEKDEKWRPLSPREIVEKAKSKLGNVGYNLIFENCEHFAKWCRYGLSKSDQTPKTTTRKRINPGNSRRLLSNIRRANYLLCVYHKNQPSTNCYCQPIGLYNSIYQSGEKTEQRTSHHHKVDNFLTCVAVAAATGLTGVGAYAVAKYFNCSESEQEKKRKV